MRAGFLTLERDRWPARPGPMAKLNFNRNEAAASVRDRVLLAARAQLRDAANDALGALEARLLPGGVPASRSRSHRQLERMREVVERDRALLSAASVAPDPAPVAGPLPECDEPI